MTQVWISSPESEGGAKLVDTSLIPGWDEGNRVAQEQAAADHDWGGFGNLVRGTLAAVVGGMMGGGAMGAMGGAAGAEGGTLAGGAFDMGGMGSASNLFGVGGTGTALGAGGAMDMGVGTGGWMDFLGSQASNLGMDGVGSFAQDIGNPGSGGLADILKGKVFGDIGLGDLLKTGGNFLFNQMNAKNAQNSANQLLSQGNALNQPQRFPYQQQALDLLSNPQDYMQNNPFAASVADRYKNYVIPAQLGKTGNPGEVLDRNGSAFANAIAGNYNSLAQILQGYGGFNQGAPNTGAAAALMSQGNNASNESFRGFGSLIEKGFPDIFNNGNKTNPTSGSTTLFS